MGMWARQVYTNPESSIWNTSRARDREFKTITTYGTGKCTDHNSYSTTLIPREQTWACEDFLVFISVSGDYMTTFQSRRSSATTSSTDPSCLNRTIKTAALIQPPFQQLILHRVHQYLPLYLPTHHNPIVRERRATREFPEEISRRL